MLIINIPELESFDAKSGKFVKTESYTLHLEHSLASLSKWEEEFERPFLSDGPKTAEETLAYVRHMSVGGEVPDDVLRRLGDDNIRAITAHLNKKMTATWFRESAPSGRGREVITAEIIYFWMTNYHIPLEFEHRHLNKLLTLIRVANEKNAPKKKPGRTKPSDMARERAALNAQRIGAGSGG